MHRAVHHSRADGSPYPEAECPIFQAMSAGQGNRSEVDVLWRKDGTCFPAECSSTPIGQGGVSRGAVVTFVDITKRRALEEALRASESRKAAIINASMDGIISIDSESRILEFNPAAERLFGYSREDAIGKLLPELVTPASSRMLHREGVKRYLETGEARLLGRRVEVVGLRADRTEVPVELSVTRLPYENPPVFPAHLRDLPSSKRSARALEESEGKYSKAYIKAIRRQYTLRKPGTRAHAGIRNRRRTDGARFRAEPLC